MASVSPLILRFVTERWKSEVPSPPHDALSVEARRQHLESHPRSYLGVTRAPEDGGGDGSETSATEALRAGRETLITLLADGVFGAECGPSFFVYRLVDGDHAQAGLVCGVSTADYDHKTVRIHEQINQTRAGHLAEHLRVVGAQSSPIALAYRSAPLVTDTIAAAIRSGEPMLDIVDDDGLRQQLWSIPSNRSDSIAAALADCPLYLVDGHHRAAASSTDRRTSENPNDPDHLMLSVLFPYEELRNQAFHRVLTGMDPAQLEAALAERFQTRTTQDATEVLNRAPTELALAVPLADGGPDQELRWTLFHVPFEGSDPQALNNIDPIRFSANVLGPVLGTDETGSDSRLSYRPGHADLQALTELRLKPNEVLFLMRPVSMPTLMAASDDGKVMPPKSTYFQPKVRSGLFVRLIDESLPTTADPSEID